MSVTLLEALIISDRGGMTHRKRELIAVGWLDRGQITDAGKLALANHYREECQVLRQALADLLIVNGREGEERMAIFARAHRLAHPNFTSI